MADTKPTKPAPFSRYLNPKKRDTKKPHKKVVEEKKPEDVVPMPEAVKPLEKAQKDSVPQPEGIKKVLKSKKEIAREKFNKRKALKLKSQAKKLLLVNRARAYMNEYETEKKALVEARRNARITGNFYREPDSKLIFVIRLKGLNNLTPKTKKVMQLLRLRQVHNGTFVKVNKATLELLRLVSPYVTFGYPNLAAVRALIYKRGYGRIHHSRTRLTHNSLIEKALGKYGIMCMEDLIHEIYTVGKHFKQANHFLWTFKLDSPKGGFNRKSISYCEGGDYGNREEKINTLIWKMI